MDAERYLIVNADDFGFSRGINDGVIAAHQHGLVSSASLMVRGKAISHAIELCRGCPDLSLGLHVDLGEWICRGDEWTPLYEVVPMDDPLAVDAEIRRQFETFCELVGKPPTHLDSHQHVHREPIVYQPMARLAGRLAVPLRHFSEQVQYCGSFYGQTQLGNPQPAWVSEAALLRIISDLPPGITELGCHPAAAVDFQSMYSSERLIELRSLCGPVIRAAITASDISLCSFADINPAVGSGRSVA